MRRIVAIVEGQSEVEAVPILIRRIAEFCSADPPVLLPPIRVGRTKLLKEGELERTVELAARKAGPDGRILILIDADDDCPKLLADRIRLRANVARSDRVIKVVIANREFESWFVAAAESIAGKRGLPEDVLSPENPEEIRDAKGWLRARMPPDRSYRETLDQPALSAVFDLGAARQRSRSFDKFFRDVDAILRG